MHLHHYREALNDFNLALYQAGGNPVILNNIGNALFRLDRLDEARQAYLAATRRSDDYHVPYRNLALACHLQGRTGQALTAYRRYLAHHPEDGQAHFNLGLAFLARGKRNNAEAAFRAATERLSADDAESATNLGTCFFFLDDLVRAKALYEQALGYDPRYLPALYQLGVALLFQGRFQEAIERLEAVVDAQPDHPQALANLGVACNSNGQPSRAIQIFEDLLQKRPNNPSALLNLGYAFREAGRDRDAERCFRRVIDLSPRSPISNKARQALQESK